MLEVFKTQSDYLAFLIGLSFSFLLLICLSLSRIRRSEPLYFGLILFSLSQWLSQWFVLMTPAWNNRAGQNFVADIFIILGLSSLVACGFAIMLSATSRGIATGIVLLILSVSWLVDQLSNFAIFGPVAFFVGLAGSLLTGFALLWLARGKRSMNLSLAALAMAVYGSIIALSLPAQQFALLPVINGLAAYLAALLPMAVIQLLCGCLTTFAMWFYYQNEVWGQPDNKSFAAGEPFGEPLMYSTYFVLAICLIMAIGGISTGLFGQNLERDMRQELSSRARMLAAALPREDIKRLTGGEADIGTASYESLKRLLMATQAASKDCRFIYLMAFKNNNVIFLVDGEPATSPDYSPPGQIYQEATATLKSMEAAPRAFLEGPTADHWGCWVTAFDVIRDSDNGKLLALLGMDIDASDWQRKIALHKLLPINITLLMIILLTGFYLSQQKLLASTKHLAESEERYRSLVEGTPNGICLFDPEGRCQAINRNALAMLGVREEGILGRAFSEFWNREEEPRIAQAFEQVKTGQLVTFEEKFSPARGVDRLWRVVLNPIKGKNDSLLGCVGILADITEKKQAEEELRTSRALLQSLLDSIPDLLMVIDRDYRIIYSNNQALCVMQTPSEPVCSTCYGRLQSREAPCEDCPAQVVFANGRTMERERINSQDGKINEIRSFPIFAPSGEVTMVIEHVRDITARKEVEEALRTRQAQLDGIFRAAPVGIGILVNRVFKEVNDQVCLMTGYSRAALLEQSSRLLYLTQEDYDLVGREKYEQIAEHGQGTVETRWQRQDGTVIDVMLSSAPLFQGEQSPEILFTAMDITERKKLEAARFTLDKMESLGIMAGGIAHDFNNVLMTILGNVSLVGLASTPAEIEERLADAEQGCRQAMHLAKQFLTFAKGGAPVKKANDLRLIIQEAARLAVSGSKSKTIFSFPDDLYRVDVDRGQMHQVFTNLLINADQAMPLGGQIYIEARNFTTRKKFTPALLPGNYVMVTIADQGTGIVCGQLDKIFDPYYSTKQKGSGLGLATVYSIVKQHGGLITCDSKLGQGAVFSLYLPASRHAEKIENLAGNKLFSGHGRVLVLEDETTVRNVMARMLSVLGYEPVFAPEGQEALDLFARARRSREPFDLVILDLTIPGGMGGLETLKSMLVQDPQTKAIVSSGYADDPVLANFQHFGFRGVITKPYRITELSEVLHKVMN